MCKKKSEQFLCVFFSSRRRHTMFDCDWSSDVCSSDLLLMVRFAVLLFAAVAPIQEPRCLAGDVTERSKIVRRLLKDAVPPGVSDPHRFPPRNPQNVSAASINPEAVQSPR